MTVTVTFNAIDLNIPFVPFPDNGTVTQSAEARVENVPTAPEVCCMTRQSDVVASVAATSAVRWPS